MRSRFLRKGRIQVAVSASEHSFGGTDGIPASVLPAASTGRTARFRRVARFTPTILSPRGVMQVVRTLKDREGNRLGWLLKHTAFLSFPGNVSRRDRDAHPDDRVTLSPVRKTTFIWPFLP